MLARLLVGVLLAVALDAVLSLPSLLLIAVDVALIAMCVVALGRVLKVLSKRSDQRAAARLLEQQLGLTGSQLINAVDFANAQSVGQASGQSEQLRDSSIKTGEELAASVHAGKAIDTQPMMQAAVRLGGVCALVALAYLLVPNVFHTVLPRYLQPFGDKPAYTLVSFDVTYPAEVLQGKPIVINATLTGLNLPDRANVVFVNKQSNQPSLTQPMLRLDASSPTSLNAAPKQREQTDTTDSPLAFAFRIDRAEQSTDFYIDTPTGRSPTYRLNVLPVPRIEQVTIKYQPPAYTGWPAQTETLGTPGIRGLVGTQVTLIAKSNMKLLEGTLSITPNAPPEEGTSSVDESPAKLQLQPDPTTPEIATVTFTLTQSGQFELTLIADNADRTPSDRPRAGIIKAMPDRVPTVQITEPTNTIIVAPVDWTVPVIVQAEDDVKIATLRLFQQRNEEVGQYVDLDYDASLRLVEVRHGIDLKSLNAQSGDKVMFFATATDNRPAGSQSADSKRFVIHVISLEEYLDRARSNYQMEDIQNEIDQFQKQLDAIDKQRQALEKEFETLAKKLAEQQNEATPEDMAKLDKLSEQLDKYAQEQLKLAQEMRSRASQPTLYDFEEAFKEMLQTHGDQLDDSAHDVIDLRQQYDKHRRDNPADTAEAKRHIERMLEQLKRDEGTQQQAKTDTNAAAKDTQRIAAADRMAQQVQRIARMIDEQRDLADRIAPYKDSEKLSADEQLRAQRLAHEQAALKQDLDAALDKLEAEATKSQNELPRMAASAAAIAEAIRDRKIPNDQANAADAAIAGRGTEAHQSADAAATKLESLRTESEQVQQAGASELADSPFSLSKMQAGQSLKQLAQGRGLATSSIDPSNAQGDNKGQSMGSRAEVSVYGPHAAGNDANKAKPGGRPDGNGKGGTQASNNGQAGRPEVLTPAQPRTNRAAAAGVRGVPAIYQEIANEYLRRLADDAK